MVVVLDKLRAADHGVKLAEFVGETAPVRAMV